jgi:hypothetical protein
MLVDDDRMLNDNEKAMKKQKVETKKLAMLCRENRKCKETTPSVNAIFSSLFLV